MPAVPAARPRRPFLIMNPRSGGGKVTRFGLQDKAQALGAEVALLEGPGMVDVAALARQAVADGADLLGVAGGDTYQGIKGVDMVPNLSPRNLAAVEIGKDFMLGHGYIKRDFDVHEWAAPQFLEKAAEELVEEEWKQITTVKLPEASELELSIVRLG